MSCHFLLQCIKVKSESEVTQLYLTLFDPKIIADGEIKRCLLLGRKAMTNLDSLLKSRSITLPTKVHIIKAMVFPVVR